ncbi:BamA/OMP85 family outer membrane protein [Blattabacterium cuenoti]|uniref:BamA/OMP85 family outer membrane protein n=1 Tax=Blattabacterium cuenoti TaxID=1653831 RepID=UPI00163CDEF0|nr:POTRA domain-containing protein [Blattabacterium cuenoti]
MKKNIFIILIIIILQQVYSSNNKEIDLLFDNNKSIDINKNINQSNVIVIVRKIHIIGKTKYDSHFISNLSGIFPGESINIGGKQIDNVIHKLWKSNLFKNISIYKKDIDGNLVDLFFELEDLVQIHEVKVKGIKKDQFTTIKKIKTGDHISDNMIQNIKNDIQEYYKNKGFNEINIKNKIIKNENGNLLYIDVDKGKKIGIEEIFFEGNQVFSKKELLNFMVQTKKIFYIPIIGTPNFVQENIIKDLKNITDKYESKGFLDAKVFLDSVWKKSSGNYGIKIKIFEGNEYHLGDINILGNKKIETDDLKKIFFYKKGDIYNKIEIKKNVFNYSSPSILSTYLNLGYLFVNIKLIEKKIIEHKINLEIQVEENNPVYINKVNISGNSITKDHVIRRELETYPGELFSPKKIKESLSHLIGLNIFEKVYPEIIPNKKNSILDIEWHVVEKNTNEFQFHGGFGGKNMKKIIGNFKLNFGNFSLVNLFNYRGWNPIPQGDGQKLMIFSQLGKDFSSYGFSFTEPWIEKTNPISITLKGFYSINKMKNDETTKETTKIDEKQFLEKIGTSLQLNKYLTFLDPYSIMRTSIDYEKFIYKKETSSNSYHKQRQFNNLSYLISLERMSTEPNIIFPFVGSKIQLNSIFTLPYSIIFNNEKNKWMEYYKFKIIFSWYKKIITNVVLRLGGEFGYMGFYKNLDYSNELYSFQKFYMGGMRNRSFGSDKDFIPLRGYSTHFKYNIPSNGGVIYDKLVLETRYLIKDFPNLKIWTNFFLEGGNLNSSYKEFHLLTMNKSFGIGIRFFWTLIGLVGVDFGYPIDNIIGQKSKWKTHFVIGKDL